jgi:putative FmdB family regulatory protein
MPLYNYECEQCHTVFEIRATFKEKEAGLETVCPQCHSRRTKQLFTAGLLIRNGANTGLSRPICGPNAGPGCCG